MMRRLFTLVLSMTLATVGLVTLAPPASAATVGVTFYPSLHQVRGQGTEYSGSSRSVCVVLNWGVALPPRGFRWTAVAKRCVDRVTNYAGVSLSTPAVPCYAGMYYAQTTTYRGSGGTGDVVARVTSPIYSTAGC